MQDKLQLLRTSCPTKYILGTEQTTARVYNMINVRKISTKVELIRFEFLQAALRLQSS